MLHARFATAAAALVLVLSVAPSTAGAGVVLSVQSGWGAHTQEDLNEAINEFNQAAGEPVAPTLDSGWDWGARVGMQGAGTTALGVGWQRLTGEVSGSAGGSWLELSVPADCWLAWMTWLPDNDQVGRVGLAADVGFLQVDGSARSQIEGSLPEERTYEGKGLFLALAVVGDAALSETLSLQGYAGFRLAQVPNLQVNGNTEDYSLDYSGVFVRAGLRWAP
jgi:hypothetical protein